MTENIPETPRLKHALSLLWQPTLMFFFAFAAFSAQQFHAILLEFHHNFSEVEIGNALMFSAATQFVTPFIILIAGRKILNPDRILQFMFLLFALTLFLLPRLESQMAVTICFVSFSLAAYSVFPMQMTAILNASRNLKDGWFLVLRSIGTLGFASFCLLSGFLVKFISVPQLYNVFSAAAVIAFVFSLNKTQMIPQKDKLPSFKVIFSRLANREVGVWLGAVALGNLAMFAGTSVIGNFIRHELNGNDAMVSFSWTLSTFTEIPLIWASILILNRFSLKTMVLIGLLSASLRMGLTWIAEDFRFFVAVQMLHGLFYGAALSGFNLFLRRRFGLDQLHSLQLFAGLAHGALASSLGGKLAGSVWHLIGIRNLYGICAILLLAGALLLLLGAPNRKNATVPLDANS